MMTDLIDYAFTQLGPRYEAPRPIQASVLPQLLEDRPKLAMLEMPTGCGKSALAVAYGDLIGSNLTTVLTATISLQEQYCLAPQMRTLTDDLRWVPLGSIGEGDKIIGFDEEPTPNRRNWRLASVEHIGRRRLPTYRVYLEDGTRLVCSSQHRWLCKTGAGRHWLRTDQLTARKTQATHIMKPLSPWGGLANDILRGYEEGFLAAAFDGEGHLLQRRAENVTDTALVFSQKPNAFLDRVREYLTLLGFRFLEHEQTSSGCRQLSISPRAEIMRFLGSIRPPRLLRKFNPDKFGMINPNRWVKVVAVTPLGEQELVTIGTSTQTLLVEGFASHNSRDFDDMVVFKGRGNYECENGLSAAEGVCMSRPGYRCDSDYYIMRREVERARRVAANYAVYLNHLFYSRLDRRPDLLVCDEGHRLLDILTQFETVSLDGKLCRKLGSFDEGWDSLESAKAWARNHQSHVGNTMQDAIINGDKKAKLWLQLHRQIGNVLGAGEDYITLKTGEVLEAAPLWPRRAAQALFRSAHNVLIQSATLYGGHTLADLLDLGDPRLGGADVGRDGTVPAYIFYTVPSPFNPARWPCYFRPVVNLNKRSTDAEWGRMAEVVHYYVHRYSNVKGVIHVAARNQVDRVTADVKRCPSCRGRVLAPVSSKDKRPESRADLLGRFRSSPPGTWLVHYSVGEGEDFTGDLGRIQLIAKTPYPDLSDRLTRLRSEEPGVGRRMYAAMTLSKIAQTAGRVMRHEGDFGETVVLDGSFRRLWQWHKDLAPSWFHDILVMGGGKR